MFEAFGEVKLNRKNIGLVGFGAHIKKIILPCLEGELGSRVVACCVLDQDKHKRDTTLYEKFPAPDALFKNDSVDLVVAAVNCHVHEQVLALSLEFGKACYVEKPPVLCGKILTDLKVNVRDRVLFYFGLNYRESETLKQAKILCDKYGGIANIKIEFSSENPKSKKEFSSVTEAILYETGIHAIDLAQSLVPDLELSTVKLNHNKDVCQYCVILENQRNQYAIVDFGNYTNEFRLYLSLYTREGVVINIQNLNKISITGKSINAIISSTGMKMSLQYDWPTRKSSYEKNGYTSSLKRFVEGQTPACGLDDAINLYGLLDQIKISSE